MMAETERLWTAKEAREFLGVTDRTLQKYRIPRIRLSARAVRYDPDVVRAWLRQRTTGPIREGRG